ncbi:MAG: HEAT repeat domain-containing protein, partial [Planctomycetes bacterium]|nr:HEAT repeat domain-containing protein [Planctomycetota bacterium]
MRRLRRGRQSSLRTPCLLRDAWTRRKNAKCKMQNGNFAFFILYCPIAVEDGERAMRRNLTWLKWSACVTLAAVVACAHAATAGNVDEEARALAPKVRDYMTKQRLIRIGLPSVGPLFEQLAATKDANMAFECRSTLRWIAEWADSDKAKADLRAAFSEYTKPEQPGPVRETAAMLLGVVGGEESVPLLKPLLNDAAARESACAALEGIPGKAATQALTDAYKTAPTPFRRTLLAALANRRDPAGLPTLIKATEDKDDEVVVAALEALGVAGERDGLSALEKAIKKGSEVRRRAAFPAYVRVGEALVKQGR